MNKILQLPLETMYFTERPTDGNINGYILDQLYFKLREWNPDRSVYIDWQAVQRKWLVTKGEYAGTLPKRLRNYMKKEYDIKLTTGQISELGNIAKTGVDKYKYYAYKFVTEKWARGLFGDKEGNPLGGSCFWGCYSHHFPLIMDAGGRAMHLFRMLSKKDPDPVPVARCFIIPFTEEPELAAFINAYSRSNDGSMLVKMARMIAADMGYSYQEAKLINWLGVTQDSKRSQRLLYINGGRGYIVADANVINGYFSGDRRELPILDPKLGEEPPEIPVQTCCSCDESYNEEHMDRRDDEWWCPDCFNEAYFYCEGCSEYYDVEATCIHEVKLSRYSDSWCENCVENHAFFCNHCRVYHAIRDFTSVDIDEKVYCYDCVVDYDLARRCYTCDEWYEETMYDEDSGEDYCHTCYDEMIAYREEQEAQREQEEEERTTDPAAEEVHSSVEGQSEDCNCAACRRSRTEGNRTS